MYKIAIFTSVLGNDSINSSVGNKHSKRVNSEGVWMLVTEISKVPFISKEQEKNANT